MLKLKGAVWSCVILIWIQAEKNTLELLVYISFRCKCILCAGYQNEGWFDPWLLLAALRVKCLALDTKIVKGQLVDFVSSEIPGYFAGKITKRERLEHAIVSKLFLNKWLHLDFMKDGRWWSKINFLYLSIPVPY